MLPTLLLTAVLGLAACTGTSTGTTNIITDMIYTGRSSRPSNCFSAGDGRPPVRNCSADEIDSLFFVEIGKEITVYPEGQGRCAQATVDFGDGSPPSTFLDAVPQSGTHPYTWTATHTYTGWPGNKLIRVKGDSGCLGNVTKEITVGTGPNGLEDFRLAFCVGPRCQMLQTSVCSAVRMPPIRKGSGVRIQTNGHTINYGSNQVFNASGDPAAPVPAGYLFPRRKKFSLVYRIGTKDFQGEAGPVTFVADQTGPLEICTNDNPSLLSDNDGEMLLIITVNERSAQ